MSSHGSSGCLIPSSQSSFLLLVSGLHVAPSHPISFEERVPLFYTDANVYVYMNIQLKETLENMSLNGWNNEADLKVRRTYQKAVCYSKVFYLKDGYHTLE